MNKVDAWEDPRPLTPDEVVCLARFGRRLRALRLEARLTQEALAWIAQITPRYLRYLEKGQRRPRASTLLRLAEGIALDGRNSVRADVLHEALLASVGIALAPESDYRERIERRRRRRRRQALRCIPLHEEVDYLVCKVGVIIRHTQRQKIGIGYVARITTQAVMDRSMHPDVLQPHEAIRYLSYREWKLCLCLGYGMARPLVTPRIRTRAVITKGLWLPEGVERIATHLHARERSKCMSCIC